MNATKYLRENLHQFSPISWKQAEEILPNSFFEVYIIVIPKAKKDTTRKKNHRPTSLMKMDAKVLKKILVRQIQQRIKTVTYLKQVGFVPGISGLVYNAL